MASAGRITRSCGIARIPLQVCQDHFKIAPSEAECFRFLELRFQHRHGRSIIARKNSDSSDGGNEIDITFCWLRAIEDSLGAPDVAGQHETRRLQDEDSSILRT